MSGFVPGSRARNFKQNSTPGLKPETDHYRRTSDNYGAYADPRDYHRGSVLDIKPPSRVDDVYANPNELAKKRGEGARVSDTYGEHYRANGYQPPRGGVALSAHAMPLNPAERMRAEAQAEEARQKKEAARRDNGRALDFRGDLPEEYGKYYSNGYDFEGYYQGLHAGKSQQSQLRGAGAFTEETLPYRNIDKPARETKLEQKPLPKHMDMDLGVRAMMAPTSRNTKPQTGEAVSRLAMFRKQQQTVHGLTAGDIVDAEDPSDRRRASTKVLATLVPEMNEGTYQDYAKPGRPRHYNHHESKLARNFSAAKDSDVDDGVFQNNRKRDERRARDTTGSLSFGRGGLGRQLGHDGTASDINALAHSGHRGDQVQRYGDRYAGKNTESHLGTGVTFVPDEDRVNEGIFDRRHRTGFEGRKQESALSGVAMNLDKSKTDDGIFDERHNFGKYAGKDVESGIGPGMSLDKSKTDDGIFDERHVDPFAGRDTAGNIGPGFVVNADAAADKAFLPENAGRIQHAGMDNQSALASNFAVKDDAAGLDDRKHGGKFAHKDSETGIGRGFVPREDASSEGIFAENRSYSHAGKDNATGLGPGMVPTRAAAGDGIFNEGRTNVHASKDSETGLGYGMIPRADAASDNFVADRHGWMDTHSNIGPGMVGTEDHQQREGFAAAYSEAHSGKDTEDHMDPGMVPQVQWKGGTSAKETYARRQALNKYYKHKGFVPVI